MVRPGAIGAVWDPGARLARDLGGKTWELWWLLGLLGGPGQPWDKTWGVLGLLGLLGALGALSFGVRPWALFGFLRASGRPEACLARDLGVRPGALGAVRGSGARLARNLGGNT